MMHRVDEGPQENLVGFLSALFRLPHLVLLLQGGIQLLCCSPHLVKYILHYVLYNLLLVSKD